MWKLSQSCVETAMWKLSQFCTETDMWKLSQFCTETDMWKLSQSCAETAIWQEYFSTQGKDNVFNEGASYIEESWFIMGDNARN